MSLKFLAEAPALIAQGAETSARKMSTPVNSRRASDLVTQRSEHVGEFLQT